MGKNKTQIMHAHTHALSGSDIYVVKEGSVLSKLFVQKGTHLQINLLYLSLQYLNGVILPTKH